MLKRPNSRACELEINASLLAPPDPCVPGPRAEDARGREALGTRMQLHYKIFRYLKRETKLEVKKLPIEKWFVSLHSARYILRDIHY